MAKDSGKSYQELLKDALGIKKPKPELDSTHQETTDGHSETIGLRVGAGQISGQPDHQLIIEHLESLRSVDDAGDS